MTREFWRPAKGGLLIAVRVKPKSANDEIMGVREAGDGHVSLAVKVRAQPEQGRANKAVIELLAKWLGVPKSRLLIASGMAERNKTILISGDAGELAALLAAKITAIKEE